MSALTLERTFDATREEVFDAWTAPEVLRRWWAAGPDWDTPLAEVDLRPGGRYRLSMRDPSTGATHTVGGEYTEVRRPERFVYTWRWEGADEGGTSVVTVEFREDGGRATVALFHAELEDDDSRDRHAHGWAQCLDSLGRRVLEPVAAERA